MKTLVILPTYCEADSLPTLLPQILAHPNLDVLIVDDESPDGTADLVLSAFGDNPRVALLRRPSPRSYAGAALDGMRSAINGPYEALVTMDADGSHSPQYIPELLAKLSSADIVVGSRYLHGVSVVNWPLHRIALSAVANRLAQRFLRLQVRDLTSGFMAMKIDVPLNLRLCAIKTQGYGYLIEFKWRAVRAGFRLEESPIIFEERQEGVSKMSTRHAKEAFGMLMRLAFLERTVGPDADCEDPWTAQT